MLFCRECSGEKIKSWQGWPKKNLIPIPSFLMDGICLACDEKSDDPIDSQKITWVNIGDGLPKYWILEEHHENQSDSHWGLPYFAVEPCSNCGEDSILSEHRTHTKRLFFFNCKNCGLVNK